MDDERARRIGKNEGLFRLINDEVEGLNRRLSELTDDSFDIVCECGLIECQERIRVPLADYERIRADSPLFFVVPGHEIPATEDVVEQHDAYFVVRKLPGTPELVARETDPRS